MVASEIHPWLSGRVLHFVRHGQYHDGAAGSGKLTPLGKKQAALVARFFASVPIERIASSDLPRAVETADILASALGMARPSRHRLLREVLPTRIPGLEVPLARRRDGARRVERVLARFFRTSSTMRHEVVVCHGNLIRSLVLRVTTGKANGWERLMVDHGGITSFLVAPTQVIVMGVNQQEHLPAQFRSQR